MSSVKYFSHMYCILFIVHDTFVQTFLRIKIFKEFTKKDIYIYIESYIINFLKDQF